MRFAYRLGVQTVLPDAFRQDREFRERLDALKRLGFWGVELNMTDPAAVEPAALAGLLAEHGLAFSMLASGRTAKQFGLSLSSEDNEVRRRSAAKIVEMIEFVSGTGAGVILGTIKGPPGGSRSRAAELFRLSLSEIAPHAARRNVKVLVEATNRYESAVANTLDEAWELAEPFFGSGIEILPDTFHMNIEETGMAEAVTRHIGRFPSFHLSENNRYFPGAGALEFERIVGALKRLGYRGRFAVEGNHRLSFIEDMELAVERLQPLLASQEA